VHPTKPWLHRHRVKPDARGSHAGYEQKYHSIEEVHADKTAHGGTGEVSQAVADKPQSDPWNALGITRTQEGEDIERYSGKGKFDKQVMVEVFPFGGEYRVKVADDKASFAKNFPKEYDARNYIQAIYTQGTYEPKVEAASLVERAKADRPNAFKGEFELAPAVGTPIKDMLDSLPPAHLKFLDGINEQDQAPDVTYAYGRITLKKGISAEKAKNIISAYIGVNAVGDVLDEQWKQAVAGKGKFPSAEAGHGLKEFKGESYRLYINDPILLRRVNKGVYETIKDKVFRGNEFGEG